MFYDDDTHTNLCTHSLSLLSPVHIMYKGKGKHGKRKDSLSISKGRTKQWEKKFAALKDYKENHGHCDVPTSTPLGNWVSRQRNEYRGFCAKKGDEPHPDEFCRRFEQLKGIGFKFVIRVRKPRVK